MKHYDAEDWALAEKLPVLSLLSGLDMASLAKDDRVQTYPVFLPNEEYQFLHEAAVIEFHGVLHAAWYNCPVTELKGFTPIRGAKSYDGGKTWTEPEMLAQDPTGKILYCPPVFGICDDTLFLLMNQMVGADLIHSLDLYRYNEETGKYDFLWSRPIPFKLNTNVYHLPNGKLLLPGRIAELDGFPNTPAVLISDSGKIDGEWRLVKIAENGDMPDGSKLVHPELSAVIQGETITIFCRDDQRQVPILYQSHDLGETWHGPFAHDIPLIGSKIYSDTLSDGRHYLIGNLYTGIRYDRSRLALLFSEPGEMRFTHGLILQDGPGADLPGGICWHYPVAWEANGRLYVIYTVSFGDPVRGAALSVVELR
ncbi:MAG: exo-alpha-sialidase [Clostridia bacterium]|nr:exo-alpha-sialidase [Clostridia bacterium]